MAVKCTPEEKAECKRHYYQLHATGISDKEIIAQNLLPQPYAHNTLSGWRKEARAALALDKKDAIMQEALELGAAAIHRTRNLVKNRNRILDELEKRDFSEIDTAKLLREYVRFENGVKGNLDLYERDIVQKAEESRMFNIFMKVSAPSVEVGVSEDIVDGEWSRPESTEG